jgi:EF-hand domain pair
VRGVIDQLVITCTLSVIMLEQKEVSWSGSVDSAEARRDVAKLLENIPSLALAEGFFQYLFTLADKDGSKGISEAETLELIEYLHIPFSRREIVRLFRAFDCDHSATLSVEEFVQFVYLIIDQLFRVLKQGIHTILYCILNTHSHCGGRQGTPSTSATATVS